MRENYFPHLLLGRKLRNDRNQRIRESVDDQRSFDELFKLVFHPERLVVQRAIRAVTLVVKTHPEFLLPHAEQLLALFKSPDRKEVKALAIQLIPMLRLDAVETERVWHILTYLVLNQNEQKSIRVNALQSLYELSQQQPIVLHELHEVLNALANDHTPSIQARVLKLRGLLNKFVPITV